MKIKKNGKVINLTESDLRRIVKRVMNEGTEYLNSAESFHNNLDKLNLKNIVTNVYKYCKQVKGIETEYKDFEMCRKTLKELTVSSDMLYTIVGGDKNDEDSDTNWTGL